MHESKKLGKEINTCHKKSCKYSLISKYTSWQGILPEIKKKN